jgi:hypothetical protein
MKEPTHSRPAAAPGQALDTPARASGFCLPALAWGLAAALGSYLGLGLLLDALAEPQTSVRITQTATGTGQLLAASISSLAGGALAGVLAQRRAGRQRVALHAYGVWLVATVILWMQIAALSGGPPDL